MGFDFTFSESTTPFKVLFSKLIYGNLSWVFEAQGANIMNSVEKFPPELSFSQWKVVREMRNSTKGAEPGWKPWKPEAIFSLKESHNSSKKRQAPRRD